eukprot:12646-Heterococcus_DN1.PRE.2
MTCEGVMLCHYDSILQHDNCRCDTNVAMAVTNFQRTFSKLSAERQYTASVISLVDYTAAADSGWTTYSTIE